MSAPSSPTKAHLPSYTSSCSHMGGGGGVVPITVTMIILGGSRHTWEIGLRRGKCSTAPLVPLGPVTCAEHVLCLCRGDGHITGGRRLQHMPCQLSN